MAQHPDWRVRRIVRDLGRLDVLRRGDVGPDVVSDDDDETAVDILARMLAEDAEAAADVGYEPAYDIEDDDDDYDYDADAGYEPAYDIGDEDDVGYEPAYQDEIGDGDDDDDDYAGDAVGGDDFDMPLPNNDAGSIAVVTHDSDENFTSDAANGGLGDDDDAADEASTLRNGEADVVDLVGDDDSKRPSEEGTAGSGVATAATTNADNELLPADVNYNHGARNPLNDPTAKPVHQPGDDEAYRPMLNLVRRQIEWFAASSKDVADRQKTVHPVTLGQVGFRCVHCAHIPFPARSNGSVSYPKSYNSYLHHISVSFQPKHFMECKEIPCNIKSHSKTLPKHLKSTKVGEERKKHIIDSFHRIGIIEKDGRLVYDEQPEDGYWLCDKCQLVKFAKFEEACRHEETCCGTATKSDFDGLDQSDRVFHRDDRRLTPDSTNPMDEGEGGYVLSLCCECNEIEDPSSDVPMLLCDRCNSATHLTCTMDDPKLTEVPEGDWFCSKCVVGQKRHEEDQAISLAFAAVGEVIQDSITTTVDSIGRAKRLMGNMDHVFDHIPGIESKTRGPNSGVGGKQRTCVVVGCMRGAGSSKRRYMCQRHFARGRLLDQIQTMPNGERRFPCITKYPFLPRDHDRAYVAIPPNAEHGTLAKCSHSVCRSLQKRKRLNEEFYAYCAVCDIICHREYFNRRHRHEIGLAKKRVEEKTACDAADAVDEANTGETETTHEFDSIRGPGIERGKER